MPDESTESNSIINSLSNQLNSLNTTVGSANKLLITHSREVKELMREYLGAKDPKTTERGRVTPREPGKAEGNKNKKGSTEGGPSESLNEEVSNIQGALLQLNKTIEEQISLQREKNSISSKEISDKKRTAEEQANAGAESIKVLKDLNDIQGKMKELGIRTLTEQKNHEKKLVESYKALEEAKRNGEITEKQLNVGKRKLASEMSKVGESFDEVKKAVSPLVDTLASNVGKLAKIGTLAGSIAMVLETNKRALTMGMQGATRTGYNSNMVSREYLESYMKDFYDGTTDLFVKSNAEVAKRYGKSYSDVEETAKKLWSTSVPTARKELFAFSEDILTLSSSTRLSTDSFIVQLEQMNKTLGITGKTAVNAMGSVYKEFMDVNVELERLGQGAIVIDNFAESFQELAKSSISFNDSTVKIGKMFGQLAKQMKSYGLSQNKSLEMAKTLTETLMGEKGLTSYFGTMFANKFGTDLLRKYSDASLEEMKELFSRGKEVGTEEYEKAQINAKEIHDLLGMVKDGQISQFSFSQQALSILKTDSNTQRLIGGDDFTSRIIEESRRSNSFEIMRDALGLSDEVTRNLIRAAREGNRELVEVMLSGSNKDSAETLKEIDRKVGESRDRYDPTEYLKTTVDQLTQHTGLLKLIAAGIAVSSVAKLGWNFNKFLGSFGKLEVGAKALSAGATALTGGAAKAGAGVITDTAVGAVGETLAGTAASKAGIGGAAKVATAGLGTKASGLLASIGGGTTLLATGAVAAVVGTAVNYLYQSNKLKEVAGSEDFEEIERRKAATGGYVVGGAVYSAVGMISENWADAISEALGGTSARLGREAAEKFKKEKDRLKKLQDQEVQNKKTYIDSMEKLQNDYNNSMGEEREAIKKSIAELARDRSIERKALSYSSKATTLRRDGKHKEADTASALASGFTMLTSLKGSKVNGVELSNTKILEATILKMINDNAGLRDMQPSELAATLEPLFIEAIPDMNERINARNSIIPKITNPLGRYTSPDMIKTSAANSLNTDFNGLFEEQLIGNAKNLIDIEDTNDDKSLYESSLKYMNDVNAVLKKENDRGWFRFNDHTLYDLPKNFSDINETNSEQVEDYFQQLHDLVQSDTELANRVPKDLLQQISNRYIFDPKKNAERLKMRFGDGLKINQSGKNDLLDRLNAILRGDATEFSEKLKEIRSSDDNFNEKIKVIIEELETTGTVKRERINNILEAVSGITKDESGNFYYNAASAARAKTEQEAAELSRLRGLYLKDKLAAEDAMYKSFKSEDDITITSIDTKRFNTPEKQEAEIKRMKEEYRTREKTRREAARKKAYEDTVAALNEQKKKIADKLAEKDEQGESTWSRFGELTDEQDKLNTQLDNLNTELAKATTEDMRQKKLAEIARVKGELEKLGKDKDGLAKIIADADAQLADIDTKIKDATKEFNKQTGSDGSEFTLMLVGIGNATQAAVEAAASAMQPTETVAPATPATMPPTETVAPPIPVTDTLAPRGFAVSTTAASGTTSATSGTGQKSGTALVDAAMVGVNSKQDPVFQFKFAVMEGIRDFIDNRVALGSNRFAGAYSSTTKAT